MASTLTAKDFATSTPSWWCPGCGDFAVLTSLKAALTTLELTPSEVLLVGGIGCSGQIRNYLNGNSFYGTHGGALAYALGAKMANPEPTVFAHYARHYQTGAPMPPELVAKIVAGVDEIACLVDFGVDYPIVMESLTCLERLVSAYH